MPELPAVLKIMQAEPTRIWFAAELGNLVNVKDIHRDLASYADRMGAIERIPSPTAKHPRRVGWRWLRMPLAYREPQVLKPAYPWSTQGLMMRVFEANPEAWITNNDLAAVYPERGKSGFFLGDLYGSGCIERRKNEYGVWEYRFVRLSERSARGAFQPRKKVAPDVEVKPSRPKPCPAARSRAPKKVAPVPDPVETARRDAQLAAARQAHWDKTNAMRTEALERVMALLQAVQEPMSATQIKDALGLTLGVMKTALVALAHNGLIIEIAGIPTTYRLLSPEFPEVPAAMNRAAERVYGLLFGRADTELGLMQLTGWRRPEVRAALARLHACGRLEWSGVGHLLIYRVREVAQERAA